MTSESEARKAERLFERLSAGLLAQPGVTEGTGFGWSRGLRVGGKIFAFVSRRNELVVKLPRERVEEIVASRHGERFDPGHGRQMREWASVPFRHSRDWERLAGGALRFVRPG